MLSCKIESFDAMEFETKQIQKTKNRSGQRNSFFQQKKNHVISVEEQKKTGILSDEEEITFVLRNTWNLLKESFHS